MTKVLFSNPPWWIGKSAEGLWISGVRAGSRWPFIQTVLSSPGRYVFGDYLPYPFFQGFAATYVREKTGAEVFFRDSIALRESYEKFFTYVAYEKFDFIFLESSSPSWEHDKEIIRQIHEIAPQSKIVITGPITIAKGEEILSSLPVHACIKGEYEKGSVRVLEGETGLVDFDFLSSEEMNAAPPFFLDALYAKRYWDGNPLGQRKPQLQMWTSRGCPYKCIFCVWPATMTGNDPDGHGKRRVRFYRPEYVENHLRELVDRYHFKTVYFDDDTFNLTDKHVLGICDVMRRIKVPWAAMCRADTISLDTWKEMRDSGCFGVKIGFESGNQTVIDTIVNKNLNLEKAREVVFELKRLGLTVHGTFTIGLPGETREQMFDTLAFIKSLPLDTYQVSGTAVLEGTPLHSIQSGARLERYPGASTQEGFLEEKDGVVKLVKLVQNLSSQNVP
ncbi:MAG TPA: radical SAM protein [Candidatus Hydrogenedentes bacterium]|nr:radical SAM protein [Candidatus Hydrogenedentota bacterium]HOL75471.1 radical SAM protein [Candidatus Hydrogenedentota bacterium]HPO86087.1 radical SAM protein [Candidatus Hydrogenedentota bacterium]